MRRKLTILVVGLLVAILAISGIVPAVSAHGDTDTEQTPYAQPTDTETATKAYADSIADWMQTRMGPEGVEAFEEQTGVTVETVAHAMAEQMDPHTAARNETTAQSPYSPSRNDGYRAPGGHYGPQMPYGPHMSPYGSYGPGMHGPGMRGPGMHGPGMGGPGMGSGW